MSANSLTTEDGVLPWVTQALDFWFREIDEELWFTSSTELDNRIRRRFLLVHRRIIYSEAEGIAGANPLLAGIIGSTSSPATCSAAHRARLLPIRLRVGWRNYSSPSASTRG